MNVCVWVWTVFGLVRPLLWKPYRQRQMFNSNWKSKSNKLLTLKPFGLWSGLVWSGLMWCRLAGTVCTARYSVLFTLIFIQSLSLSLLCLFFYFVWLHIVVVLAGDGYEMYLWPRQKRISQTHKIIKSSNVRLRLCLRCKWRMFCSELWMSIKRLCHWVVCLDFDFTMLFRQKPSHHQKLTMLIYKHTFTYSG